MIFPSWVNLRRTPTRPQFGGPRYLGPMANLYRMAWLSITVWNYETRKGVTSHEDPRTCWYQMEGLQTSILTTLCRKQNTSQDNSPIKKIKIKKKKRKRTHTHTH